MIWRLDHHRRRGASRSSSRSSLHFSLVSSLSLALFSIGVVVVSIDVAAVIGSAAKADVVYFKGNTMRRRQLAIILV